MQGVIEVGLLYRERERRREVLQVWLQRQLRREEYQGLYWWYRAKGKEEKKDVRCKYGEALDRYFQKKIDA